jgi:hypothetical protein
MDDFLIFQHDSYMDDLPFIIFKESKISGCVSSTKVRASLLQPAVKRLSEF